MSTRPDILARILQRKQQEIATRQTIVGPGSLRALAESASRPRGFIQALRDKHDAELPAVIAEIKKASPSQGVIRAHFDPPAIARSYAAAGAACLSVLTDEDFFQGHDDYLKSARAACSLPVIRKDFIVDPYQVYEARALGADCILLIVAALDSQQLQTLYQLSSALGMDTLVEVHDRAELEIARQLELEMIGINNRDLRSFDTRLETTVELLDALPESCIVVTESGIHSRADVQFMLSHGVQSFLVGEAFMRADDPGKALKALFFDSHADA